MGKTGKSTRSRISPSSRIKSKRVSTGLAAVAVPPESSEVADWVSSPPAAELESSEAADWVPPPEAEGPEEAGFPRLTKKTPPPTSTTSSAAMPGMSHWGRLPLEGAAEETADCCRSRAAWRSFSARASRLALSCSRSKPFSCSRLLPQAWQFSSPCRFQAPQAHCHSPASSRGNTWQLAPYWIWYSLQSS